MFISADEVDPTAAAKAKYDVPFPILSDPEVASLEAFNVVHTLSEEEYARLKGFDIDVEAYSRRDHRTIARAALFLVSPSGEILWSHADTNYRRRPSIDQILGAITPVLKPE